MERWVFNEQVMVISPKHVLIVKENVGTTPINLDVLGEQLEEMGRDGTFMEV